MLKELAVQGSILVDDNVSNVTSLSITSVPSLNSKVDVKGIFKEKIDFTIAVGSGIPGTCVLVVPVSGTINPTSIKDKIDGKLVMRKDDSVIVFATGQTPSSAPCPLTFNIRVDNPNQIKVKGE